MPKGAQEQKHVIANAFRVMRHDSTKALSCAVSSDKRKGPAEARPLQSRMLRAGFT
jgi:hypothetical protein